MEYKGYNIASDPFGHKYLKTIGRGSLPITLRGSYTSTKLAMIAIDNEEGKKNAKASNTD